MRTTERMIDLDLTRPRQPLANSIRKVVADVVVWTKAVLNRRAANRLLDLDEHLLADIGLSPDEVHKVLKNHSIHQDPSMQLTLLARKRAMHSLN